MLYFSTTKSLTDHQATLSEGDGLLVFYKENESIKMGDLAKLISSGSVPTQCEPVENRDDMLVLLGAHLAQTEDKVTFLDPSIPIPKRYADRIILPKAKAARKRKTKKAATSDEKSESKEDHTEKYMNPPGEIPETAGLVQKSDPKEKTSDKPAKAFAEKNEEETAPEKMTVREKWIKKMQEKNTADASKDTVFIPSEKEPEFSDPQAKILYGILGIKSEDVGFSWPTEMLMLNIIRDMESAETDADFEMAVRSRNNGDKVWEKIKDHVEEIKEIV